jgi:hypothetical protein
VYLKTFVESFKKFLKTVNKGLQRNRVQLGSHVCLHVFSILKPLSFERSFHLGKKKNLAGARSGEHGGWFISITPYLARNGLTTGEESEGSLLCNKNQLPSSARNCGITRETRFNYVSITSTQNISISMRPESSLCLFTYTYLLRHGLKLSKQREVIE